MCLFLLSLFLPSIDPPLFDVKSYKEDIWTDGIFFFFFSQPHLSNGQPFSTRTISISSMDTMISSGMIPAASQLHTSFPARSAVPFATVPSWMRVET
jgi:hypothetical protein